MTFGAYLRRLRLANRMGLRELARAVSVQMDGRGVTHAYLSMIESGRIPPPRLPILQGLASVLAVSSTEMEMAAHGWAIIRAEELLRSIPRSSPLQSIRRSEGSTSKRLLRALVSAYDRPPLSLDMPKCLFLDKPRPFVAFRPRTKVQESQLMKFQG